MPSSIHEAPLALFRERPELAAELLHDLLGVEVPAYRTARVIEADFTQLVPTEYRADLVVELDDGGAGLAVIVEVQRQIDERKRYAWPLYTAALHARRRGPTCLVVIATDRAVAAWARGEIATLQPGSPFAPLVIGPDRIPKIVDDRVAAAAPELAMLSALAHGASEEGAPIIRAALHVISTLASERSALYFDLLIAGLAKVARSALEHEMRTFAYEYQSDFARKYFGDGVEEGRATALRTALGLFVETRLGTVSSEIQAHIDGATADQLLAWITAVGAARDVEAVHAVFSAPATPPTPTSAAP